MVVLALFSSVLSIPYVSFSFVSDNMVLFNNGTVLEIDPPTVMTENYYTCRVGKYEILYNIACESTQLMTGLELIPCENTAGMSVEVDKTVILKAEPHSNIRYCNNQGRGSSVSGTSGNTTLVTNPFSGGVVDVDLTLFYHCSIDHPSLITVDRNGKLLGGFSTVTCSETVDYMDYDGNPQRIPANEEFEVNLHDCRIGSAICGVVRGNQAMVGMRVTSIGSEYIKVIRTIN